MNSSIDAKRPWMSLIPNKAPHSTIAEGFVQGVLVRAWKKMMKQKGKGKADPST